ncbi:MAG: hypothetical protein Q8O16_03240, partial [Dehalococcoidia bacterium]|nr:hypothetical protein [Dehalococcoidia bacterium]
MRRMELTREQLETIMKLRQRGFNWQGIQRETGIPRRVAARAYRDNEMVRSVEELKAARRELAAEEFREHRDALIALADMLVSHLDAPTWKYSELNADQYLDLLWAGDLAPSERPSTEPLGDLEKTNRRRTIRQNHLLFKALREHTMGAVHWEALDEWKAAWNGCIATMPSLRQTVKETMKSLMARLTEPD